MPQPVQYRGMALIVPDNDSEWTEYYAHARAHRLVARACSACGLMRYPPTHACPSRRHRRWRRFVPVYVQPGSSPSMRVSQSLSRPSVQVGLPIGPSVAVGFTKVRVSSQSSRPGPGQPARR